MKISIVVCTYNRSQLLIRCLDSLTNQTTLKSYEILIVNNNSSDDTKAVIDIFQHKYKNIRCVFERKQGISFARNRGYKEAKGKYIAYIDDDAWALKNWIDNISDFIERYPRVNIFGGPYDRYSLSKIPEWFPKQYGILNLGNKEKILIVGKEWITEANLIVKKEFLESVGGFRTGFGHIGKKIAYGEGPDLLIRASNKGEKIYYVPNIKVKHLVSENKFSLKWLLHSDFERGRASKKFPSIKVIDYTKAASAYKVFYDFFYYLLQLDQMPVKKALYLALSGLAGLLGYLYESTKH